MASKQAAPPLTRAQALWLLVCAVLTLIPDMAFAPSWLTIATVIVLLWRGVILWRQGELPPRWLLGLLVVIGTLGVFLTYRQLFGKDPGIALLILFLALKLMEMRTVRDGLAVVFLCYFLLLTHFLNTQSIEVAGFTLSAMLVITAALSGLAHAGRSVAEQLRLALLMLGQAVPFLLVLFLLFPRIQGPLWGMPIDAYSGMTGLSDSMSPGSISQLSLSGEIAFRARFAGAVPPQQRLYWRGPVLRFFDGHSWRAGFPHEKVSAASTATTPPATRAAPPVADSALTYEITLEPHNKPWLFALEMPLAPPPANAILSAEYQVLAKAPVRQRMRYTLRSDPELAYGLDESPVSLKRLLGTGEGNPQTRQLVANWRRAGADDRALIARMLQYFRNEAFFYTLTPPLLPGADTIDQFLFQSRRGFCEHYASAFVFAMRAAGIPARVVTGYQGGSVNPVDGYLIVRQSDAHAWAEVWLEGVGWQRVDPTAAVAPNRVESGLVDAVAEGEPVPFVVRADLSWLRQLRFQWDAVTNAWNQWVLGYDPQRQREVLSRLGLAEPDWRNMTAIMAILSGLLLFGLTLWALRNRSAQDPVTRQWQRLSRKLARLGLARRPWEGPLDYAERVAHRHPELAAPVRAIAALYVELRYARQPDPGALRALKSRIRQLKPSHRP